MPYPKKTLIALTLIVAVVGCVDLGFGLWWKKSGAYLLRDHANRKFRADFNFEKARTNFLTRFSLENVSSSKPFKTNIKSVTLHLEPWHLILPVDSYRGIASLRISEMSLDVVLPSSSSHAQMSLPPALPAFYIFLDNSDFTLQRGKRSLHFENVSGSFLSDKKSIRTSFVSRSERTGSFGLAMSSELSSQLARIKMTADNFELKPALESFLGDALPAGIWTGRLDAELESDINFARQKISFEKWIANFKAMSVVWVPEKSKSGFSLVLEGEASPLNAQIKQLKINKTISVRGTLKPPYANPILKLEAKATDTNLVDALRPFFSSLEESTFDTSLNMIAQIEGTIKEPIVHSTFSVSPSLGVFKLPLVVGNFDFANQKVSFQSAFSKGSLSLAGEVRPGRDIDLEFDMKNISLTEIGSLNGWNNVRGLIFAKTNFTMENKKPRFNGDFRIDDFAWGRLTSEAVIKGAVDAAPDHFVVTTFDQSLNIQCDINKSQITLNQFELNLSGPSSVMAEGHLDLQKATYDLQVRGKNIQPDFWPPLVSQYPDITGHLDFDGNLQKRESIPEAQGKLVFHETKFISTGHSWAGELNLKLDRTGFSMEDIEFTGGYRGSLSRRTAGQNPVWTANLNLTKADPTLFAELLKSTAECTGFIDGQLNGTWDGEFFIGNASGTWSDPQIRDLKFEKINFSVLSNGKNILFNDLSLFDQGKALRANMRLEPAGREWKYFLQTQSQQWGTDAFRVDGELNYEGRVSWAKQWFKGTVHSNSLMVNDLPVDNVTGTYEFEKKVLSFDVGSAQKLKAQGTFGGFPVKLSAHLSGNELSIKDLFSKLLVNQHISESEHIPEGKVSFDVELTGVPRDYAAKIDVSIKDGFWRNENFDGRAHVDVVGATISVVTSTLAFKNGGAVFITGRTIPNEVIDFSGFGKAVSIESAFHWLNWPLNWPGITDTQFSVTGAEKVERMVINFDGRHKGFGPFSEAGIIQGQTIGEGEEWDLSGIRATFGNGFLQALPGSRVYMDKDESGRIHITADIRNLKAGVLSFFGQTELSGVWGKNNAFGAVQDHFVDIDVFARPLWVNQLLLSGNITHVAIKKGRLEFSPILGSEQQISGTLIYDQFPNMTVSKLRYIEGGKERFFLDGEIGTKHWDFLARGHEMDSSVVSGLLDIKYPVSGPMDMDVHGAGSPSRPEITGKFSLNNAKVGFVPIDHAAASLHLKDGMIELTDVKASRKNGFDVNGFITFATGLAENPDAHPLFNLKLEKGDFRILREIWPDVTSAKGSFKAEVRSHNDKKEEELKGSFHAESIQFQTKSYLPSLKCADLNILFDRSVMQIKPTQFRAGRGVVQLAGNIAVDGTEPSSYDLSLKSVSENGISIRIPELSMQPGPFFGRFGLLKNQLSGASRGEVLVDLTLRGPDSAPVLAGNLKLENTMFTYPPSAKSNTSSTSGLSDFLAHRVIWDVTLKAGSRTHFENELVDANVSGEIHFDGVGNALVINGKVNSDQGQIVYSGNEFKLVEAQLEIITPHKAELYLEPNQTLVYLRGKAEREVYYTDGLGNNNQDTITMELDRSLIGEIRPRFYSKNNPSISSEKALQLALGFNVQEVKNTNPLQNTTPQGQAKSQEDVDKLLRAGVIQLVDSGFASPLARALARSTGLVDTIRVSYQPDDPLLGEIPDPSAATNASQNQTLRYIKGTKVKFGREVSNKLYADYSVKVDEFENQLDFRHEVELAYRLKKSLFIRGISELDSQRTLGRSPDRRAILENQWRFGLPKPKKKQNSNPELPSNDLPTILPVDKKEEK